MKINNYFSISASLFLLLFVLLFASYAGCNIFPLWANGCQQEGVLFTLLYGLLYTMIVLTLIIVPLIAIIYIRVTIIMPISKMLYDDETILDAGLFGWFDSCWNYLQRVLLGVKKTSN